MRTDFARLEQDKQDKIRAYYQAKKELEEFAERLRIFARSEEGQKACNLEWDLEWEEQGFFDLEGMRTLLKNWSENFL